jgi:hypothetical protein
MDKDLTLAQENFQNEPLKSQNQSIKRVRFSETVSEINNDQ